MACRYNAFIRMAQRPALGDNHCSPGTVFVFFGLFCLLLLVFIFDKLIFHKEWKRNIRTVFCLPNVIGGILLCVLTGYLSGNILQPKPEDTGMSLTILQYGDYKTLLLLFEAAWMLWIPFLYRRKEDNTLLFSASIILLILPFFSLGYFNDLCMRASIPALFVSCMLLIKNMTDQTRSRAFLAAALCLLIVCSSGGRAELSKAVQQSTSLDHNRCMTYNSITEQIDAFPAAMYQYVDWSDSKISSLILR